MVTMITTLIAPTTITNSLIMVTNNNNRFNGNNGNRFYNNGNTNHSNSNYNNNNNANNSPPRDTGNHREVSANETPRVLVKGLPTHCIGSTLGPSKASKDTTEPYQPSSSNHPPSQDQSLSFSTQEHNLTS